MIYVNYSHWSTVNLHLTSLIGSWKLQLWTKQWHMRKSIIPEANDVSKTEVSYSKNIYFINSLIFQVTFSSSGLQVSRPHLYSLEYKARLPASTGNPSITQSIIHTHIKTGTIVTCQWHAHAHLWDVGKTSSRRKHTLTWREVASFTAVTNTKNQFLFSSLL